MLAEILAIGDEITSGQVLDTNSQWLSRRLAEMGVRVLYHSAVGDELEPLASSFRLALGRADIVISTGGLGPTADDVTREAVALATGRKLVADAEALESIRRLFARRQRPMPKRNERQAMLPENSRIIPNPNGTAPGIALDAPRGDGCVARLFALPGVPAEMREMWHGAVAETLRGVGAGRRVIVRRNINCFGAGESQVEAMLPELIRRGREPSVGITASGGTIILRIVAEGATEEQCRAAIEPTASTIYDCLGDLVFGEGDEGLEHAVVRLLRRHDHSLATVEWGTGGLIAHWLAGVEEAEGCYLGGGIVGNEIAARRALSIAPELIVRHGAAGAEVAEAMATGCRERFGADVALAVGGFPAVNPDASAPKPYHLALATAAGVQVKSIPLAGHPALLRTVAAKHALNLVRLALAGAE